MTIEKKTTSLRKTKASKFLQIDLSIVKLFLKSL